MKLNILFRKSILACIVSAVAAVPAWSKTVLNFNSQFIENTVSGKVEKWFADEVTRRTDGEVEVKMFFGEGLGRATESLFLLSDGAIDLASMSAGYFPAELPLSAAPNSIPMALSTVHQSMTLMTRVLDEVPEVREEHANNGIRALFFHNLNEYYILSVQPILTLSDLKGKKVRTWGSEMPRLATAAGAVPVTLSLSEIYESFSRGTIDAVPLSYDYMRDYRLYEVAKHIAKVPTFVGPTGGVWISEAAWQNLSPEHQEIVDQVAQEALQLDFTEVTGAAQEARAVLVENGVTVHDFPDEEFQKWRDANPDFFADFVEKMTAIGKKDAAENMVRIWADVRSSDP